MKSRRNSRRRLRKTRKARSSKSRYQRKRRVTKGGALTAIPNGSVVTMRLDPKDPYSIPVTVGKETAEQIIEDATF